MSTKTKGAIRNLHVPLPEELYESLRREAERQGSPATEVARDAIRRLLDERRREQTRRELEEYIRKVAGTTDDLDPALERAGIASLLVSERRGRRGRR